MSPEHKFNAYIVTATVSVMYVVITKLIPQVSSFSWIPNGLITIASTVGTYHVFSKGLGYLARKSNRIKKHFLGASFLQGTWAGSFTDNGEKIITIEHFEQSLSGLKIRGQAFSPNGTTYAQWLSTAASVNSADGTLTYTYESDSYSDNPHSFKGIGFFQFDRESEYHAPIKIHGYSADLNGQAAERSENRETKIDDALLKMEVALDAAKKMV